MTPEPYTGHRSPIVVKRDHLAKVKNVPCATMDKAKYERVLYLRQALQNLQIGSRHEVM